MPTDGVIRVEDLLRSPALQLRLIAGESGPSRRVAWAHVSELEDPTPWLVGAEMIMTTGIAVPDRRSSRAKISWVLRFPAASHRTAPKTWSCALSRWPVSTCTAAATSCEIARNGAVSGGTNSCSDRARQATPASSRRSR